MSTPFPGVVVDASLAAASGTSGRPPALYCADALGAIERSAHMVLLSDELRKEWLKHRSRYFDRWWKVMTSRKRIARLRLASVDTLTTQFHDVASSLAAAEAMVKDAHLAAAGIEHNGRVLALDDTVRKLFGAVASQIAGLGGVLWANPAHPEEKVVAWIAAGTPDEPKRRLASIASPTATA